MTFTRLLIALSLAGIAFAEDCKTLKCLNGGVWKKDFCWCECTKKYFGETCSMLKCPTKEVPACGKGRYIFKNCAISSGLRGLCPKTCKTCEEPKDKLPQYVVELYIVVEWQVVRDKMREGNTYEEAKTKIKSDVKFTIGEVNRYYKSLEKRDIYVEFRVKKLDILYKDHVVQKVTASSRVTSNFIGDFQFWLMLQQSYLKHKYDLALLLTGLLWRKESSPYGVANIKKVCSPFEGVAVADFRGIQGTTYIIAHELGHALGAQHDVDTPCKGMSPHYIMHWRKQQYHESFGFSDCSAKAIKDGVSKNSCVKQTTTPAVPYDIADYYDDDVMKPDKICQRVFRDNSIRACPAKTGDNVCRKLLCNRGTFCEPVMPTEGFKCGSNGRCVQGVCKESKLP